ncbi:hypothetical protein BKA82DRAFT_4211364 [Pisolithus tinctorius]|nr:hypothetical protein BKA82DRAFT_4211364 [Pisolithus tinctorius]
MSLVESMVSVSSAFDTIPIIDIGHASTPKERAALAQQIREACMSVGFFYIKNHGIPEETIDKVLSAMKAFFALPTETKMKLHHRKGPHYRGYEPLLDSNIDPANRGDLYEGFVIGKEDLVPKEDEDNKADDDTTVIKNLWPSEPAEFREAFVNYYHAAFGVAKDLYRLFALASDLPETYFDDKFKRCPIMRGLHYPPQTGPEDDRIIGIEPGIQALQILNSEKKWINATQFPVPWSSSQPCIERSIGAASARYSIPLFNGTDPPRRGRALPTCVSLRDQPNTKTINSGEYEMYQGSFTSPNGTTER